MQEDTSDDGVSFITNHEVGYRSLITVKSSTVGYLDAWIDLNKDGTFSGDEIVINSKALEAGDNNIVFNIPDESTIGTTWMRLRASSTGGLTPYGGISGGEVEDYQIEILDPGTSTIYYPSESEFAKVGYEDKWPDLGDYDFNDVVVNLRTRIDIKDSNVKRYIVQGNLLASGAGFHNGFAIRFPNVNKSNADAVLSYKEVGGAEVNSEFIDPNANELIVNIFDNIRFLYSQTASCTFFRTETGCLSNQVIPFEIRIPISGSVSFENSPKDLFDPFIYAVNGYYHGPYVEAPNARSLEVHLQNTAPSELFDSSLLNQGDDFSLGQNYFVTSNNLPFALELPQSWMHPLERVDFLEAYPDFRNYVESNGSSHNDWFNNPNTTKVISEE